ncbi:MAG: cob(I)yrinic acid a,c-diamide adenosyltransferase [Anaerolineales bacterium]|jgi:cob(I)alamin adenosyltransferase
MPRLTKLYTGKGDQGTTHLTSGEPVSKDDLRVRAYGSVDELNSALGVARALAPGSTLDGLLGRVQNELFHLGAELSASGKAKQAGPTIEARHVQALEMEIDELMGEVGSLDNFVLPTGTPAAAALHLARSICRRAERELVAVSRREQVPPAALSYLNRLSDLLFAMALYENKKRGRSEVYWDSRT